MYELLDSETRVIVSSAQVSARRLGHRWIGTEHLFFAVAASEAPVGAALRAAGVAPRSVWDATRREVGVGAGALDRDALAATGIDLDRVRAGVEKTFGPGSLTTAGRSRSRRERIRGHIPFNGPGRACLDGAMQQAEATTSNRVDPHALALALLTTQDGTLTAILTAIGTTAPTLRAALTPHHPGP